MGQLPQPTYSREVLPRFVVFEGLDGSGTSTQAAALDRRLRAAGIRSHLTHEPSAGPAGHLIKLIMQGRLLSTETREQTDRQLAYLFAADRHDHLYNAVDGVSKLAREGHVVVSTRYFFSSYAYNARSAEDFELVARLNRDFPLPEVVVYLTVPLDEAISRLAQRGVRELYEHEDELARVAANYSTLFAPLGDRVLQYESQGNIEELGERIFADVVSRLSAGSTGSAPS